MGSRSDILTAFHDCNLSSIPTRPKRDTTSDGFKANFRLPLDRPVISRLVGAFPLGRRVHCPRRPPGSCPDGGALGDRPGQVIDAGVLVLRDGLIESIGENLTPPPTPGFGI